MKLSVFTPSHNPRFLNRAWESIRSQADGMDFEWVILLNGEAVQGSWTIPDDPRVRVVHDLNTSPMIGALKRKACELCTGDVLIELDHDDELMPGALAFIERRATQEHKFNPKVFIYSPTIEIDKNGNPNVWGKQFGWEHDVHDGCVYNVPFDITARSLCEIFYAPNHVRAWTREAYDAAGGHDAEMECGDDHDLMIRTYLAGASFVKSDVPLYRQNFHGDNSQNGDRNARIQVQQAKTRDKYLTPLVHEWCRREEFAMLDFGGAFSCPDGYIPVDVNGGDDVLKWNIASQGAPTLESIYAFTGKDYSGIGCIRAKDFLEHIPQPRVVPTMNAIHKALVPGGWLLSMTPSTDGRGAWQDPTHVSFWNQNSWLYYTREEQAKYVPQVAARFQAVQHVTLFPGEWERANDIPYVQFNGCALHGQRQPGLLGFPRR
jgi:glycosyltransferase involved in cell wall biosynthesis